MQHQHRCRMELKRLLTLYSHKIMLLRNAEGLPMKKARSESLSQLVLEPLSCECMTPENNYHISCDSSPGFYLKLETIWHFLKKS